MSDRLRGTIVSVAGGRDEAIRTLAGSNTVAGLAATMMSLPSGGEVRLDDLGDRNAIPVPKAEYERLRSESMVATSKNAAESGFVHNVRS